MKKLIFLLAISIVSYSAVKAQSYLRPLASDTGVHKAGLDTISGPGTISQILQVPGWQDEVTIQSAVIKLSGTLTAGAVKLYGSVDGVRYDYATTAIDSLAVTNLTTLQVKTWKIVPSPFQYYKVVYKGWAATQTSTISSSALIRKQ